ncbi:MAG: hypothetical protein AB1Z98_08755 [Nannocystaceae bacterium]
MCLATGLLPPACRDDGGSASDDAGATEGATGSSTGDATEGMADETGTTGDAATVTFWQDVAPVLYDSCVSCHRQGGIGPFSLETYELAQPWAAAVAASTQARTMPPWLVTDDGTCGEFRHSRWLPQDDVDLIAQWVEAGSPPGQPRDDLQVPQSPGIADPTVVPTPSFTPEIQGGELAAFDEYRCFLVDPGLPADRFLTGYDVLPGNDAIVHHVLVMPVDPTLVVGGGGLTNADVMQDLDDQSPERAGWPCFGEAGDGVETSGIPVVWAPGQGVVELPEGTGLRVRQQEVLVVQVHYNLADPATIGQSDQTDVHLRLAEQVEREGFMILPDPFLESIFGGDPIELPPGEESVEYTWEIPVVGLLAAFGLPAVELYGVFPHMHEQGRSMHFEIDGPAGPECVADVPRWDFGWQLQYFYEQPRPLVAGETLRVTCDFDTTGATEPVVPGWGTRNEMCLMGMYLVP